MLRLAKPFAFILALSILAVPVLAQEQQKELQKEEQKEEPKEDTDAQKYDKAVKDLKKYDGAFTIYLRKNEVLLELPEDRLDRPFLVEATLYSGFAPMGGQAGEPLSEGPLEIFTWQRKDDKIMLVHPRTKFRWDANDPLALASERTFPDAVLASYAIEQKNPDKKLLLVNVSEFFHGSVFGLDEVVSSGSAGGSANLDEELTDVDNVNSDADETSVRMNMHYRSHGDGGFADMRSVLGIGAPSHLENDKSIRFKVTYSLWYRKDSDYVPRVADPRIGYFTQDFFSVSRFDQTDRTERYITRFDLRKKNPFEAVSEPVEPIVWYIDPSVPKKFRPGVRAGILAWNKAFEAVGFKDAIVVKDAPENDPAWDHADGRHNLVRWNMSESSAYAVAWSRMDPMTGQVLNAAVSVDANYPTYMLRDYNFQIQQGSAVETGEMSRKALLRRAKGEPDYSRLLVSGRTPSQQAVLDAMQRNGWNRGRCEYGEELAENAVMGWTMLKANGAKISEDDFMYYFLEDLVMHEIGHCLGLRHNFAGSTQLSVADLLNDAKVRQLGLSASVMDYTPLNTPAVLRGDGVFFNDTVGPYDMWAIQYGYTPTGAKAPGDDKVQLDAIARRTGEPGHTFLTDEDADGINPIGVRFDLGSDTVDWIKTEMQGHGSVRSYAINQLTKNGEGYAVRNKLILTSYLRDAASAMMATRFVGGVEMRRMFKGDVNERPTLQPASPKSQRQAMMMVIDKVLKLDGVGLPASVLNGLSMDPNSPMGGDWNAPLRAMIGGTQMAVLSVLMSASKADDIIENDFKMAGQKDRYTIAEHYNWLFAAVFKEVGANQNVSAMRRDLQQYMIEGLIMQAQAPGGMISDDVRVIASQGLNRLKLRFDKQIANAKKLDELTVLHLKDISDRIGRYQKRLVVSDR